MELSEAIQKRRSIRRFKADEVSTEDLDAIMRAGTLAPTGCNRQEIDFIAVVDPLVLNEIRSVCLKGRDAFYSAPAVIFCIGHGDLTLADLDCGAAMENMALTATDLGLGSVWVHSARAELNEPAAFEHVRERLGLLPGSTILDCLAVGHPDQEPIEKLIKSSYRILGH